VVNTDASSTGSIGGIPAAVRKRDGRGKVKRIFNQPEKGKIRITVV